MKNQIYTTKDTVWTVYPLTGTPVTIEFNAKTGYIDCRLWKSFEPKNGEITEDGNEEIAAARTCYYLHFYRFLTNFPAPAVLRCICVFFCAWLYQTSRNHFGRSWDMSADEMVCTGLTSYGSGYSATEIANMNVHVHNYFDGYETETGQEFGDAIKAIIKDHRN